jgi:hypothetical protein
MKKLKIRSGIRAGVVIHNHNQSVRRLRVRSGIKAGAILQNHNQTRR